MQIVHDLRVPGAAAPCPPDAARLPAGRAGIGLKPEHFDEVLATHPPLGFFEVHAENYFVAGGPFHHYLGRIRADYPLSVHGVGLSIGGEGPLDATHLRRLSALLDRYQPESFSEHLAWSSHGGAFLNDLLPVPYDRTSLETVCAHLDELQRALRRRVLLENPSTYVEFAASTWSEPGFIAEVVRRTGCGLLLDVNNLYVSSTNHRWDAMAYLRALPPEAVGEIHLAGFTEQRDAAGDPLLIDTHGSPVAAAVWALYESAVALLGRPVPTLIERDRDLPALPVLTAEALEAERRLQRSLSPVLDSGRAA